MDGKLFTFVLLILSNILILCECSHEIKLKVTLTNGKTIEKQSVYEKNVSATSKYRNDAKSVHVMYIAADCSLKADIERVPWAKCDSNGDNCVWFVQTFTNY